MPQFIFLLDFAKYCSFQFGFRFFKNLSFWFGFGFCFFTVCTPIHAKKYDSDFSYRLSKQHFVFASLSVIQLTDVL